MDFEIKNRFTGNVQFVAKISCEESTHYSIKVGLAVEWAIENKIDLRDANLRDASLRDADLRGANLSRTDLRGANLRDADLRGANLSRTDLRDADLSRADLCVANLRDADLRGANLRDADLRDADLRDANLSRADLSRADLCVANLRDANLRGANLRGANLSRTDLRGANLRDADLCVANLSRTDLRDADLSRADLRSFKHDLWGILIRYKNEIPELINYIRQGKIDGSCYSGECSCLMRTFASIKQCDIDDDQFSIKDGKSPAEQWFSMIKPGDTPENNFASKMAIEWIEEFTKYLNGEN